MQSSRAKWWGKRVDGERERRSAPIPEAVDPYGQAALDLSRREPKVPFIKPIGLGYLVWHLQLMEPWYISVPSPAPRWVQVTKLKFFCGKRKGVFPLSSLFPTIEQHTNSLPVAPIFLPKWAPLGHWKQVLLESKRTTCFSLHHLGRRRHISHSFLITSFLCSPPPPVSQSMKVPYGHTDFNTVLGLQSFRTAVYGLSCTAIRFLSSSIFQGRKTLVKHLLPTPTSRLLLWKRELCVVVRWFQSTLSL